MVSRGAFVLPSSGDETRLKYLNSKSDDNKAFLSTTLNISQANPALTWYQDANFGYVSKRPICKCIDEQKCFYTNCHGNHRETLQANSEYGNIQDSERNYLLCFRNNVIFIWGPWQKSCHSRDEQSDRWFCTVNMTFETNSCQLAIYHDY